VSTGIFKWQKAFHRVGKVFDDGEVKQKKKKKEKTGKKFGNNKFIHSGRR
jgi:hypothetical protein